MSLSSPNLLLSIGIALHLGFAARVTARAATSKTPAAGVVAAGGGGGSVIPGTRRADRSSDFNQRLAHRLFALLVRGTLPKASHCRKDRRLIHAVPMRRVLDKAVGFFRGLNRDRLDSGFHAQNVSAHPTIVNSKDARKPQKICKRFSCNSLRCSGVPIKKPRRSGVRAV